MIYAITDRYFDEPIPEPFMTIEGEANDISNYLNITVGDPDIINDIIEVDEPLERHMTECEFLGAYAYEVAYLYQ